MTQGNDANYTEEAAKKFLTDVLYDWQHYTEDNAQATKNYIQALAKDDGVGIADLSQIEIELSDGSKYSYFELADALGLNNLKSQIALAQTAGAAPSRRTPNQQSEKDVVAEKKAAAATPPTPPVRGSSLPKEDRQRATSVSSVASNGSVKELTAQLDGKICTTESQTQTRKTRKPIPLPPVKVSSVAHCREYLKDWVAIRSAMSTNKIDKVPQNFSSRKTELQKWLKGDGKSNLQEVANLKCNGITIDQTGIESGICGDITRARENNKMQDIQLDKNEVRPIITHQIGLEKEAKALVAAQNKQEEEKRVQGLIDTVSKASINNKTKKLDMKKFKDAVNGIVEADLQKVAKAVSEKATAHDQNKLNIKLLNANKPKKRMMPRMFRASRGLN